MGVTGALLRKAGDPALEVRDDLEVIGPGPGEVRVRIRATGVCHSDVSFQNGTIPIPTPSVLGHEGAGEVIAVGDGVRGVSEGDPIIVAWIPPCGSCFYCLAGQPNLCMSGNPNPNPRIRLHGEPVYGNAGTPTFIEETVIPAASAIAIDRDVPFDVASLIGCGVTTGAGAALNTARVQPGSTVIVFGAGGIGLSVLQGARVAGAAVIVAVDKLDSKLEIARQFGATHTVKPDEVGDARATLTGGLGFDYGFEAIGLSATIRAAWDATRRGGTVTVVGVTRPDDMVAFSGFELFYSEKRLLGCVYGSADVRTEFGRLLRLWRSGQLELERLITGKTDIHRINDAFRWLIEGEAIRTVIEF